ncbi:alpha/beta hydrolase family protein [Phocaeicola abscessus]|uniref:alpha/beta hydrolase family protein n=1 Tax=Phocaeicola abscessus TaxID=555313 RepID=UPI0028E3CDDF|nr:alpha/beta hydrolase family protein [Phocaeicola abscessus]
MKELTAMNRVKGIASFLLIVLLGQCKGRALQEGGIASERKDRSMECVSGFNALDYFCELYENAEMKYAFHGKDKADFIAWQKTFRPRLMEKLGIAKIASQLKDFEPKAKKIDSEDIGFALRERWVIWTEPTVPLPFIILFPKERKDKYPLMISPHGHGKNTEAYAGIYHSEEERREELEGEYDISVQAVKRGFIAIAPTTRGFGKTRTAQDIENGALSSCRTLLMHDLLVGRTPIGDRVWDVMKLIDWALEKLPVDASKIVVYGNSGGGTVSLFAGACDIRIAASMPSSYFCTFTGSIGSIHHCDCNYISGILDYGEMSDIAGLTAPRLFGATNGRYDEIFPAVETKKAFVHLQEIYAAAGVPANCELYFGEGGHRVYRDGAYDFLKRHGFCN